MSLLLLCANIARASLKDCSGKELEGEQCKTALSEIHPTQFAVGMIAVNADVRKLSRLTDSELREYLSKHPAPAVFGPDHRYYIVDHHHLSVSLLKLRANVIVVKILKIATNVSIDTFWKKMSKMNWVYPYDESGRGPLDPKTIPAQIQDLRDDPYRSLSWAVREKHGYDKSSIPFAEFQWANFFRSRVVIKNGATGFRAAVDEAMDLARSDEARDLPGYRSPTVF